MSIPLKTKKTDLLITQTIFNEIRKQNDDSDIYLIVTHGVFSNGLYELSKCFTKIYTSNSYRDCDVEADNEYTVNKEFLKQFIVI